MKRYSSTPCDSRCLYATGHDCTCSCGGRNHGRGAAPSLMLPGLGDVTAGRAEALAIATGVDLTLRMRAPRRSVSRAAGHMENHAPLFRGSPANLQAELFTQLIDLAGDDTGDLWGY